MGPIQSSVNRLNLAALGAVGAISKTIEGVSKTPDAEPGIDERMALTSRQRTLQKIKAIQMNKKISDKAKSRRIGKALNEYRADLEKAGGKK